MTPDILGARGWFAGGLVLDTLTTPDLRAWPTDGMLIMMLYHATEVTPGAPYRRAMMGNDTYFYQPATGVFGHNDDTSESVRARYGADTIVMRGAWVTDTEYKQTIERAMAAGAWP